MWEWWLSLNVMESLMELLMELSRCSLHMLDLCVWIRESISVFNSGISGVMFSDGVPMCYFV